MGSKETSSDYLSVFLIGLFCRTPIPTPLLLLLLLLLFFRGGQIFCQNFDRKLLLLIKITLANSTSQPGPLQPAPSPSHPDPCSIFSVASNVQPQSCFLGHHTLKKLSLDALGLSRVNLRRILYYYSLLGVSNEDFITDLYQKHAFDC